MRKNEAGQTYGFMALQADGTAVTTGVTGQRKLDGAAAAAITGALAHVAGGWWEYTSSAADTDGEFVLLNFSGGSMVPVSMNFDTRPVETTGSIGGGSIEGQWRFNTSTAAADPGSGRVGFNNATYTSVTAVYISEVTDSNFNMSDVFDALVTGDRFLLARDSDGSVFIRLTLTGAATDNNGWWTIPVSYIEHAGSFGNNNVLRGMFFVERGLTAAEIAQLRYRLQMDGSQVAPAANAPLQLQVDMQAIDGNTAAAKVGAGSGLLQVDVTSWQDTPLPGGANMIENDGANNGRWTQKALEQGPVATGFSTHSAADVWAVSQRTITGGTVGTVSNPVTVGTNQDKTGYSLSAAGVSAIWAGMTAAAANKQADHTLRRSYASARASSDGDAVNGRSLLGMVARGVNKQQVNTVTGRAEFYHEDDSTIFFEQVYTVDATAQLITGLDTV